MDHVNKLFRIFDMKDFPSPDKTIRNRANDVANRFERRPCDYVYRYERDETAKLLKKLVEFVDQTEALVTQYCEDQTNQNSFIENLKIKIRDAQNEIQQSQDEIERQKRLQALFAKFGKRNLQSLISFLKDEFESKGYDLRINSDDFETQFFKYVSSLPQPDIQFLTTEFAKLQTIDRSEDNRRDLEPIYTSQISPAPVIGDGKHIGSEKNYDK